MTIIDINESSITYDHIRFYNNRFTFKCYIYDNEIKELLIRKTKAPHKPTHKTTPPSIDFFPFDLLKMEPGPPATATITNKRLLFVYSNFVGIVSRVGNKDNKPSIKSYEFLFILPITFKMDWNSLDLYISLDYPYAPDGILLGLYEGPDYAYMFICLSYIIFRLEGKVAIITGGASGIGASAVRLFFEHGATVIIADIQDDLGRTLASTLGDRVIYHHCDVSNEDSVSTTIDVVVSTHGKLDIMYNNAGVMDRFRSSILDTTPQNLDTVLSVNLYGAFHGAKHAARVMLPRKKGCILFTASACCFSAIAGISSHPYMMSKYGVLGLVKNLTAELGKDGIRVNCISPSGVFTGMVPPGRSGDDMVEAVEKMKASGNLKGEMLTPESVAAVALYLVSDEANYVSGVNLVVDGGLSVVTPLMNLAFNRPQ
ncbi:LOW QUALITY PROTEIN: uncharacterized protein [Phyllobates terribilis]|uniref:LOW QUALITY PROTEIN: uncharacterized protein n=1 Tax=Phyllobates terribilis TaxID=111132 RepID=UPI003CCA80F1